MITQLAESSIITLDTSHWKSVARWAAVTGWDRPLVRASHADRIVVFRCAVHDLKITGGDLQEAFLSLTE